MTAPMARRRRVSNAFARLLITLGGFSVIAVVVAIVVFIEYETLPLWKAPSIATTSSLALADSSGKALVVSEDEYRTVVFTVTDRGLFRVVRSDTLVEVARLPIVLLPGDAIVAADVDQTSQRILAGSRNGFLTLARVDFSSGSTDPPEISIEWESQLLSKGERLTAIKLNGSDDVRAFMIRVDSSGSEKILAGSLEMAGAFGLGDELEERIEVLGSNSIANVRSMALDRDGRRLVL
ncbi:MAG: hypothetical protein IH628_16805, partial [Proteobacteria bacterium]|nr:hypothetical protein [Pseudomonadota bacterium]